MASESPVDLSKILTPALLQEVLDYTFPWKGPVDVPTAGKLVMAGDPDDSPHVFDTTHFRALKPMSALRPSIPDLVRVLPPQTDLHYPERVLATILLVDQAPRKIYTSGTDLDWQYAFFDPIAKQFVKTLLARNAFPDATKRWMALGYSFEDAMFRRLMMYVPFIHSEDAADHTLVDANLEEMRREVEVYAGKRDPGRETRDHDRKDTILFSKMIMDMILETDGPPKTFAEFMFWVVRLFDAHYPIVEQFGQYPYRNDGNGRKYTTEEEVFMKQTNNFGKPAITEEEAKTVAENLKNGTWEELSDKRPVPESEDSTST